MEQACQGDFSLAGAIEAPGVRVELRNYHVSGPVREASTQSVYTIGMRAARHPVEARYPAFACEDLAIFRQLGEVVFRPPNCEWEAVAPGARARVVLCIIEPDRFENLAGRRLADDAGALLGSFDVRSALVSSCLARLRDEALRPRPGSCRMIEAVTDTMVLELERHLYDHSPTKVRPGTLTPSTLRQIETRLRSFEYEIPHIRQIAELIEMSPRRLQASFLKTTGETIGVYCTRLRLEKAAGLLRETNDSVKQVAFRAGFRHPANFSTAFRRRYGKQPSEYRRSPCC